MRKTSLESVFHLAKLDKRVLFIGSDLGSGVLDDMKFELPKQWFMEGVSEQHIIGMAAGLAFDGFVPYVNTIATNEPTATAIKGYDSKKKLTNGRTSVKLSKSNGLCNFLKCL